MKIWNDGKIFYFFSGFSLYAAIYGFVAINFLVGIGLSMISLGSFMLAEKEGK